MIKRYSILTAAFLLSVRCVSAGIGSDLEQGADSSLPDLNPGQAREVGRPLYRMFTKRDEGVVNHTFCGGSGFSWIDDFWQCQLHAGIRRPAVDINSGTEWGLDSSYGERPLRNHLAWRNRRSRRASS